MQDEREERGQPATIDRATGEVHGSGSGAGGGNLSEDHDADPMAGGGAKPIGAPQPADGSNPPPKDKHQGQYG